MTDDELTAVFSQAFRTRIIATDFKVSDIEQWDSLTHIKLIIELETTFFISIGPDDIESLYSDYQTVKSYVETKLAEQ